MIPRTLEPELMDGEDQAAAYASADFAEVNRGFVARLLDMAPEVREGAVLDLGCGPGDIAIRLCRECPDIRVTGVDGAGAMIGIANKAAADAGVPNRARFVTAMLPNALPGAGRFDAVISNSLLHHLPEPAVMWHELIRLAAPGAHVLVIDLARPVSTDAARALVDQYAGGEPDVLRIDFYNSLLAAFTEAEVASQLAAAGLAGSLHVEMISDRHLCVSGRLPETAASSRDTAPQAS